jgi:hypothetical protein
MSEVTEMRGLAYNQSDSETHCGIFQDFWSSVIVDALLVM